MLISPFGAAFIVKEYANMPSKTNRMRFFFLILSAVASLFAWRAEQTSSQEVTQRKKQTPEERAAEKQRVFEMQNEIAMKRQKKFGLLPANDDSEIGKKYQAAFEGFRKAAVDLNQVQMDFHLASQFPQSFKDQINQDWQQAMHHGFSAKASWLKAAGETFASDPDKYITIGESLSEMMLSDVELDRMDGWLEAAKSIVNSKKFERENVLRAATLIAYANSDFDFSEQCLARSEAFHSEKESKPWFTGEISSVRAKWERELAFRKQEAETNDNPRVEFVTTKGRLVMELFEDTAPETVKSFIYLVERGFYNRKSFFRVEKHLCAQTGCEKGDGTGDAGYTIPGEAKLTNHRDHFRGSIAMALGSDEAGRIQSETGSSQIYFAFLPMSHLDGNYTVFGRVIDGIETMNCFRVLNLADAAQRKEGKRPDSIITCKVLRKRDTVYKPKILAGKLPK